MVNNQLGVEEDLPASTGSKARRRTTTKDPLESLGNRVSAKLEEGELCLACSDDSLAVRCPATLRALQEKHPSPHSDL